MIVDIIVTKRSISVAMKISGGAKGREQQYLERSIYIYYLSSYLAVIIVVFQIDPPIPIITFCLGSVLASVI